LWGFAAAQLMEKIILRLESLTGKLALVAMIADFVRTPMTSISVNNSGVARGNVAESAEKPERQNQPEANTLDLPHFDTPTILNGCYTSIISRGSRSCSLIRASH
jgi:hypothetical protein